MSTNSQPSPPSVAILLGPDGVPVIQIVLYSCYKPIATLIQRSVTYNLPHSVPSTSQSCVSRSPPTPSLPREEVQIHKSEAQLSSLQGAECLHTAVPKLRSIVIDYHINRKRRSHRWPLLRDPSVITATQS